LFQQQKTLKCYTYEYKTVLKRCVFWIRKANLTLRVMI